MERDEERERCRERVSFKPGAKRIKTTDRWHMTSNQSEAQDKREREWGEGRNEGERRDIKIFKIF